MLLGCFAEKLYVHELQPYDRQHWRESHLHRMGFHFPQRGWFAVTFNNIEVVSTIPTPHLIVQAFTRHADLSESTRIFH